VKAAEVTLESGWGKGENDGRNEPNRSTLCMCGNVTMKSLNSDYIPIKMLNK
jgi:hypothetical protein